MEKSYGYIGDMIEDDPESRHQIFDEALDSLELGDYTSEFISGLVYFAKDYDLEAFATPLAILKDAFHEIKERCPKRSG